MSLERFVQSELNKLDPDLFLDKEWWQDTLVYVVKYNIGSGEPPFTVLEWMVAGHPLPLSSSIIDRVKQQEGDIRDAIREATVNNAVKKAGIKKDMEQIQETIAEEFEKSSKVLHRSGPWASKHDVTAYKRPGG